MKTKVITFFYRLKTDLNNLLQILFFGKLFSDIRSIFIALIEHKAHVDYNAIMQVLRYMVFIWEDYEKRQEKKFKGVSKLKSFKYSPIFPIMLINKIKRS